MWDSVVARGQSVHSPVMYSRVNIDLKKIGQNFCVRMPNGDMLQTSAITPEIIWPYAAFGRPKPSTVTRGTWYYNVTFPCDAWVLNGYSFEFENGHLVGLGIGVSERPAPDRCRPAIGRAETPEKIYRLPLTEEQLTDLFGTFRRKVDTR